MRKTGLGRGLDALMADNQQNTDGGIVVIRLSDIEPNKKQARRHFDEQAITELADSIKAHGLLQPITVRHKSNGFYEIIAGERRWRACKQAGLTEIPAMIREADDKKASELSLIENLQREGLNPIEEACGYRDLMQSYGLTQEEAAVAVGKSRAAVANSVRLLKLPQGVLDEVFAGRLSEGHARTLIPLCSAFSEAETLEKTQYVIKSGLSVRQTEQFVKNQLAIKPKKTPSRVESSYYRGLERRVGESLGRKAIITKKPNGSGSITLAYGDSDDLTELIKKLCGNKFFQDGENNIND